MSLQRQHFLLSYFKTLSVGPAGIRTHDLPLSRPALSQLSKPGGGDQSADAVHGDDSTDGASHLLEDSDDDLEFTFRLMH